MPAPESIAAWKDGIEAVQSGVTILALVLGGIWAYFKVVKGRVYTQRLEPLIDGKIVSGKDFQILIARVTIRNVGITRVNLNKETSVISVDAYRAPDYLPDHFHNAFLTELGTVRAIQEHAWIEPGECITERRLFALPPEHYLGLVLRLRLRDRPSHWLARQGIEWYAVAVLTDEGSSSQASQLSS